MCELLADLLDVLSGGVEQDSASGGKPEAGRAAAASAPPTDDTSDDDTGGEGGSAPVQLQEPEVPPADDDVATADDTRDQAEATPATSGRPARRKPRAKPAAASPAK